MLSTHNIGDTVSKEALSIYIGQIERDTLDLPMDDLSDQEQELYSCLKEQMIWGQEHGFNLVMTKDSDQLDCWMIKDSSMDKLNPIFKQTIYQVF